MVVIPRTPNEYRAWWAEQRPDIPYGYCWCGCGEKTNVLNRNVKPRPGAPSFGFKGEPRRFVHAHQDKKARPDYLVENRGFDTPCWVWQKTRLKRDNDTYGVIKVGRKKVLAHRLYYEAEHGPIADGKELHHRCRVRLCCRPSHMLEVTRAEHTILEPRNPGNPRKLPPPIVQEIKRLYATGRYLQSELAKTYGVNQTTISSYVRDYRRKKRRS